MPRTMCAWVAALSFSFSLGSAFYSFTCLLSTFRFHFLIYFHVALLLML
jgi:hypothetical protein